MPKNPILQVGQCIVIFRGWIENRPGEITTVPLMSRDWGTVQHWSDDCSSFVPKIVVAGVCAWSHALIMDPSIQQLNVEIMKGISEAILEDVRSPMTSQRLQYTMGQCLKKVLKAVKVYASTDQKENRISLQD